MSIAIGYGVGVSFSAFRTGLNLNASANPPILTGTLPSDGTWDWYFKATRVEPASSGALESGSFVVAGGENEVEIDLSTATGETGYLALVQGAKTYWVEAFAVDDLLDTSITANLTAIGTPLPLTGVVSGYIGDGTTIGIGTDPRGGTPEAVRRWQIADSGAGASAAAISGETGATLDVVLDDNVGEEKWVRVGQQLTTGEWAYTSWTQAIYGMDAPLISEVGTDRITVSRGGAPDIGATILSYDLRYQEVGESWTTITGIGSSTMIAGLTSAGDYEVQTAAVTAGGRQQWSRKATVTTLAAISAQPSWDVDGVIPGGTATLSPGSFPVTATPSIAYAYLDGLTDIAEDIEDGWDSGAETWDYTPATAGEVTVAVAWTYSAGSVNSEVATLFVGAAPVISGVSVDPDDPIVDVSSTRAGTGYAVWNQSATNLGTATIISTGDSAAISASGGSIVTDGSGFDGDYYAHVCLEDDYGLVSNEYVSGPHTFLSLAPAYHNDGSRRGDSSGFTDESVPLPAGYELKLGLLVLTVAGDGTVTTDLSGQGWTYLGKSSTDTGSDDRVGYYWWKRLGTSESDPEVTMSGSPGCAEVITFETVKETGTPISILSSGALTGSPRDTLAGGTTTAANSLVVSMVHFGEPSGPVISSWANADLADFAGITEESASAGDDSGHAAAAGVKASAGAFGATTLSGGNSRDKTGAQLEILAPSSDPIDERRSHTTTTSVTVTTVTSSDSSDIVITWADGTTAVVASGNGATINYGGSTAGEVTFQAAGSGATITTLTLGAGTWA